MTDQKPMNAAEVLIVMTRHQSKIEACLKRLEKGMDDRLSPILVVAALSNPLASCVASNMAPCGQLLYLRQAAERLAAQMPEEDVREVEEILSRSRRAN